MFCTKCGAQVADEAAFCIKCGAPISINTPAPPNPYNPPLYIPPGYKLIADQPKKPKVKPMYAFQRDDDDDAPAQPSSQTDQQEDLPVSRKRTYLQRESKEMKEQIPDPTFTKFIDAPDAPIPFWYAKILIAIVSLVGAGWALLGTYQMGAWELIRQGITQNVPGVPLLMLALYWIVSAVCNFCSKRSKGAAGLSGVCYLFAAGTAFLEIENYPDLPMLGLAAASGVCAMIVLISAAGGVSINLDA